MLIYRKNRGLAIILAFSGTLTFSGLHKFYLGQPIWGFIYAALSWTLIPKIASAIEGFWYLTQDDATFDRNFNGDAPVFQSYPQTNNQVESIANAVRELEALRQDGLISEYEFEQKRRYLLDQIS